MLNVVHKEVHMINRNKSPKWNFNHNLSQRNQTCIFLPDKPWFIAQRKTYIRFLLHRIWLNKSTTCFGLFMICWQEDKYEISPALPFHIIVTGGICKPICLSSFNIWQNQLERIILPCQLSLAGAWIWKELFLREEASNNTVIDLCQLTACEKVTVMLSQHLPKHTERGSAKKGQPPHQKHAE